MDTLPEDVQSSIHDLLPRRLAAVEPVSRRYAPSQEVLQKRKIKSLAEARFKQLPPEIQKQVKMNLALGRAHLARRLVSGDDDEPPVRRSRRRRRRSHSNRRRGSSSRSRSRSSSRRRARSRSHSSRRRRRSSSRRRT